MSRSGPSKPAPSDLRSYGARIRSGESIPPPLDAIPWLMVTHAHVLEMGLDTTTGFFVSLVDGTRSVGELVALAVLPRTEAMRLLTQCLALGVIELYPRGETPPDRDP
jgi:hypothetical protein